MLFFAFELKFLPVTTSINSPGGAFNKKLLAISTSSSSGTSPISITRHHSWTKNLLCPTCICPDFCFAVVKKKFHLFSLNLLIRRLINLEPIWSAEGKWNGKKARQSSNLFDGVHCNGKRLKIACTWGIFRSSTRVTWNPIELPVSRSIYSQEYQIGACSGDSDIDRFLLSDCVGCISRNSLNSACGDIFGRRTSYRHSRRFFCWQFLICFEGFQTFVLATLLRRRVAGHRFTMLSQDEDTMAFWGLHFFAYFVHKRLSHKIFSGPFAHPALLQNRISSIEKVARKWCE